MFVLSQQVTVARTTTTIPASIRSTGGRDHHKDKVHPPPLPQLSNAGNNFDAFLVCRARIFSLTTHLTTLRVSQTTAKTHTTTVEYLFFAYFRACRSLLPSGSIHSSALMRRHDLSQPEQNSLLGLLRPDTIYWCPDLSLVITTFVLTTSLLFDFAR